MVPSLEYFMKKIEIHKKAPPPYLCKFNFHFRLNQCFLKNSCSCMWTVNKKMINFTAPVWLSLDHMLRTFKCTKEFLIHLLANNEYHFFGGGEFFFSIILPWSCAKVAKKFCRKLFTWNENFHFKFFRNPSISGRAVNEKMISLCFTGPFWAFLGTPTITHHHDSLSISLLHQEV